MLKHFLDIIFPEFCITCRSKLFEQEKFICLACQQELPLTNFKLDQNNPIYQLFAGRTKIEAASALLYFTKHNRTQKLLHQLKYKAQKDLPDYLFELYKDTIVEDAFFETIDAIIPVPLHKRKLKQRGYNQSELLANSLSKIIQKPVVTNAIERQLFNESQTKQNKQQRFENVENIFALSPSCQLTSCQHILLVDDVITTGATLEACINALSKIEGIRVSIFALAYAKNI